jgi:hypothetical protein
MPSPVNRYERIWADSKGKLRDAWGRFVKQWQDVESFESQITQSDRLISQRELSSLLNDNVCEIIFVRRRPERAPVPPRYEIRRMICTNAGSLLQSEKGFDNLGFRYPKTSRRINGPYHDIVCVWDILMRDYRNVSISTPESPYTGLGSSKMTCHLRQTIPVNAFWRYYENTLLKLSPAQRLAFMDSVT